MKKYKLRCQYCGAIIQKYEWWLKLRLIFTNRYVQNCPVCHKKMELVGAKDRQKFVCSCGHKESMQAFENRRKKEGAGVSKKDVANYMKKMKKEEKQPLNNALADALANLKL